MGTLEIRKFKVEDYLEIERRKFDMLTFLHFPDPKAIATRLARGPSYTMVNSEHVIASGGILPLWKGVGEAWVVSSDLVPKHYMAFVRTVVGQLNKITKDMSLDRVQTTVNVEHAVSIKWVEWMGFEREGLMRKFIGGQDYYRYARVRS